MSSALIAGFLKFILCVNIATLTFMTLRKAYSV